MGKRYISHFSNFFLALAASAIFFLLLPAKVGFVLATACSSSVMGVSPVSTSTFYADVTASPKLDSGYVGYQLDTGGSGTFSDLWVKEDSFTSPSTLKMATNSAGLYHVGNTSANSTKYAYFYLITGVSSTTTASQGATLHFYEGKPGAGGTENCSVGVAYSGGVKDTGSNSSNKVNSVVATTPTLGGTFTVTVTGTSGQIGSNKIFSYTPASLSSWPPDCYVLKDTSVTLSGGNTGTTNHKLTAAISSTTSTDYTAVYTFQATCVTTSSTPVAPVGYFSQGSSNIAHVPTTSASYTAIPPISPATNLLSLTKSVSPTSSSSASTTTYSVNLINSGVNSATLDDFQDTLPSSPANVSYVSGSSKFDSDISDGVAAAAISDPSLSSQVATWSGSFTVAAGKTGQLTYRVSVPSNAGTYTNSVIAHSGSTQIDQTVSTTDNAPATVNYGVVDASLPNLSSSTKTSSDINGGKLQRGDTIRYTININNTGGSTGTGVHLTDTIDSNTQNLTNVVIGASSTNCGSSYTDSSSSTALNITGLQITASGTCKVTFDVSVKNTATNNTSILNTATISSASEGGLGASPTSTPLVVKLDPNLVVTKTENDSDGYVQANQVVTYTLTITDNGLASASGVLALDSPTGNMTVGTPSLSNCGSTYQDYSTSSQISLVQLAVSLSNPCVITYGLTVASGGSGTITNSADVGQAAEGGNDPSPVSASTLTIGNPPSNSAPNAPTSLGPSSYVNGSFGTTNNPQLTFSQSDPDIGNQVKYEIIIDDSSDFSSPVVDYTSALAAQGSTSFTVGQAAGSGTYTTGSAGQTLSDGSYYWKVKTTDSGNLSSSYTTANSGSIAFKVDTVAPSGGSITYTDGYYNSASVALTVSDGTDSGSGIDTSTREVDRKSAALSGGTCGSYGNFASIAVTGAYPNFTDTGVSDAHCYQYRYLVSDAVGNTATYTSTNTAKVDTTAPSVPGMPSTTTPTTSTTPTWTWTAATDATSGLGSSAYSVQWCTNSSFTGCSSNTASATTNSYTQGTALSDGTWYFRVKSNDAAGNSSSYSSNGSVVIDTTAPTTPGTPSTTTPTTNTTPTWSWTASTDSGVGLATNAYSVQWCSDSSYTGCSSNTATATTNSYTQGTTLADGTWYFRVKASDSLGNISSYSSSGSVVIDTTAPVISNLSVSRTSSSATITWTTNEAASSIVDYGLSSPPGTSTSETDTSPRVTSHSVTISSLSSCTTYFYRVRSKDAVANQGSSSISSFTTTGCIGNSSPDLPSMLGPSAFVNGSSGNNNQPTLTFSLTDPDSSDTVKYEIIIDDSSNFGSPVVDYTSALAAQGSRSFTVGQAAGSGTYTVGSNNQTLADGSYYWKVKAIDNNAASGSYATANSGSVAFIVDTTSPTISSVVDSEGSTTATITWTTNENSSSQVEYGLVPAYGFQTSEADTITRVTSHSVSLSSLKSCARYFYHVLSTDAAGNQASGSRNHFSTTGCAASQITNGSESSVNHSSGGNLNHTRGNDTTTLNIPADATSTSSAYQINDLDTANLPASPSGTQLIGSNFYDLISVDNNNQQISSFNSPVTFTINYSSVESSGFDVSTFDLYKYTGTSWSAKHCSVNSSANTVTCSLSGFSVYALFGSLISTPSPSPDSPSNTNSSSSTSGGGISCTNAAPQSAPDLFQITTSPHSATLYFSPVNPVTDYYISYGLGNNSNQYGTSFKSNNSSGVVSYTINDLSENTLYSFKVRGGNGCAPGNWSQSKSAQTTFQTGSSTNFVSLPQQPTGTIEIVDQKQTVEEIPEQKSCGYTVLPGDSLWKIAANKLGNGAQYPKIIQQNVNKYPNIKNGLTPGWQLSINCPAGANLNQSNNNSAGTGYNLTVKMQTNGKPLAGVAVELHSTPMRTITDKDGLARFTNVEGGNHTLAFAYQGYAGSEKVAVSGDKKDVTINISVKLTKNEFADKTMWAVIGLLLLVILFLIFFILKRRKNKEQN